MKRLTNSQKIEQIKHLCALTGVSFVLDSSLSLSKYRKYIVVSFIGNSPFYYTLSSFLCVRSEPEHYVNLSRVVISNILV